MRRRSVLVTGGTGFVGRPLVCRLAADAAANPLAPAVRVALRAADRGSALPRSDLETVVIGDLSADTDWRAAVDGVSCIVHSAGLAHLPASESAGAADRFTAVNVEATIGLARAASSAGVERFVFVSSIKVNGESTQAGRPFRPADPPAASDHYGRSKLAAEAGLRKLAEATGLEVVIVRPPLVYGPFVRANFGALLRAVSLGVPLPFGSIRNARSLIAVDNLVDFLVVASHHPAAVGQTLLVSDGDDLSTPELVRRIGVALDRPARLLPVPVGALRAAAALVGRSAMLQRLVDSLQVDSASSHARVHWTPPITVDEGLRRAVAPLRARIAR